MKKFILLIAITFYCLKSFSQAGRLDSTFGTHGIVTTDFGALTKVGANARQVLLANDKTMYLIVNTGERFFYQSETLITHLLNNGDIDTIYGHNGYSTTVQFAEPWGNIAEPSAALQNDGKIVVAGSSNNYYEDSIGQYVTDFALARYNTDGTLDTTFSDDGKLTTDLGSVNDVAHSIAIQNDGKIVVAGKTRKDDSFDYDFAITRYNPNGTLDTTFAKEGKLTMDFSGYDVSEYASSIAVQTDGKIVIAGLSGSNFALARLNADGSLDTAFSADGKQITDDGNTYYQSPSMAIQNDGKIIVAGSAIARYNPNGSLDSTFGSNGIQKTEFGITSMSIQNDKIVVTGSGGYGQSYFQLARYNTNGKLDKTFSGDGKVSIYFGASNEIANSVVVRRDGDIVVSGYSYDNENNFSTYAVARLNTDGTFDNSFSKDGKLTNYLTATSTTYNSLAVQKDGKIVAVGTTYNGKNNDFAVGRYNTDGTLDSTFSGDGKVVTHFGSGSASSVAIQTDGKIVIAGSKDFVRFNGDGSLDSTFAKNGRQTTDFWISAIAIQNDGRIVVAGSILIDCPYEEGGCGYDFAIARYSTDGSLDSTFSHDGKVTTDFSVYPDGQSDYATSVKIQGDGKIVVAGATSPYDEYLIFALSRYNTDGTLDTTFSDDGKQVTDLSTRSQTIPESWVNAIAIQNDQKIVAAGVVWQDDERYQNVISAVAMARYNTDGALDTTFSNDGRITTDEQTASAITIQSDGKIIIGGSALIRYNTNGSLDSTFGINGVQKPAFPISDFSLVGTKLYAAGSTSGFLGSVGTVARYLLDIGDTPPTVTITNPTNNATYLAPANIKLSATASDTDGTISKVEFYNGTHLLHTEFVYPYGFKWRNVPVGNYRLTAKAYDNSGRVATSAPVQISVVPNKPPIVSIIKPANHKTYLGPANIDLEAAAKDPDGKIKRVEFYNGSTLLRTEFQYPYRFTWRSVPVGNYTVTAKAWDNWGVSTTSNVVNISVVPNKAPTVSIINPANGETFTAPDTVLFVASAADADGRITRVEFYNGTTLLGTEYQRPYRYRLINAAAGTYTITAVAVDNWGAHTTSAPITVRVVSPPATIVSNKASVNDKAGIDDPATLNLAPNPATNIININTKGLQQNKLVTISVLSSSGVIMKTMQTNSSTRTVQLDVSSLAKGVYTIKLISGDILLYKQFVKL